MATIPELEQRIIALEQAVAAFTRPSNAELATRIQEVVDKTNAFKNEQIKVFTTSSPTVDITGSDGTVVTIPSWNAVRASAGYDLNLFERSAQTTGAVLFRAWPNQRIAAPTAAQGWAFSSNAGENAVLRLVKITRGSTVRTQVGTITIANGQGTFDLVDHTLDYNDGVSLEVQSGSVSALMATLRYLYLV